MDDYLAISALQHYAYCPRQFALIHVEQAWAENRFTVEGQILHQRVDSYEAEQRGEVRTERSVSLQSNQFQLIGKMDLLEIKSGDPVGYFPVEYKRGKPKVEPWDEIQLCAQAFCIEEMRDCHVSEGAIWYWDVRKRAQVIFDDSLRSVTLETIEQAHQLRAKGESPKPEVNKSRCKACSLNELCEPDVFRMDKTVSYIAGIGE